ncbi:endoplasmic reticulum metallopeptidase 1-like [Toxorhynchites rutilus septentrionalis]|uniref:endoplasmic reticulum metallopeptidase 1-like n=1 Tax=Toxorhynchites rutilus septentrionalis TaxID=329112 RepID=UPI0024793681|nr:endoplasmic reticulum metallopeptidase 1-like [Toxorhynchites rutilus septentrionalis]XP_055623897.1 endoplasmic reticulum metallopeptidase 1-like [Toxorhynchites rutilus septentrionalis]XP_055623898.1 endoplasmic reticulum metallopeptidase 1-like [Toxorhynchites rutilus septentrionalis]XP_055623899.1 endoplasmic reticulum metallopeptidase 1-like [Toxorhynchites rutilus septentrionalis]
MWRVKGNRKQLQVTHSDENSTQVISVVWAFVITVAIVGIFFLVQLSWTSLPTPLHSKDELSNPGRFIAQVAQENLVALTSNGPRVGGSYNNEVFTTDFLRMRIAEIISQANPVHKIELETQKQNGYINRNVYREVQNVLVKMVPAGLPEPDNYLMLSSHYDSVPQSPGAGDAGGMIVVMLEVLRKLSQDSAHYQHGIVFVFNNLEEKGLIGAHAFAGYHRWWGKVRAFINMDAAASGGREIMFQAGPKYSFLMKYYRDYVPYPSGTAVAEELFQAGLVPSNTDYYMYAMVLKGPPGMDFAQPSWGYMYHTEFDSIDSVPLGALQHTGDNILSLTRALANAPELLDIESHEGGKAIFFDYINLFMVYYPDWAGILLNSTMIIIGLGLLAGSLYVLALDESISFKRIVLLLMVHSGGQLLSIVVGVIFSMLMAVILNAIGYSMSWFSETWLVSGLYMCPFLISAILGPVLMIRWYKLRDVVLQTRIILFLFGQQLIFLMVLIVTTAKALRSDYVLTMGVLFFNASTIVNLSTRFKKCHWIYIHLFGQLIPIAYYCYIAQVTFSVFIPMQNRTNAEANPEIIVCVFSIVDIVLISSFLTPLVAVTDRPIVYLTAVVLFWVSSLIVMLTPVGFPYRAQASPQRHYVYHIERNFYEFDGQIRLADSHFYVQPQDVHTPSLIKPVVPEMERAIQLMECRRELYCGIPGNLYHTRHIGWWIPAESPRFPTPVRLRLLEQSSLSPNITRFDFSVQGTDHMRFYVSPMANHKLIDWSFTEKVTDSGELWNGQQVHFVVFMQGNEDAVNRFWLTVEHGVDKPVAQPSFHFNVVAQYMHHEKYRTPGFQRFVNNFPDYAHVVAVPIFVEGRVF